MAPTALKIMGLEKPRAMTGTPLIKERNVNSNGSKVNFVGLQQMSDVRQITNFSSFLTTAFLSHAKSKISEINVC